MTLLETFLAVVRTENNFFVVNYGAHLSLRTKQKTRMMKGAVKANLRPQTVETVIA